MKFKRVNLLRLHVLNTLCARALGRHPKGGNCTYVFEGNLTFVPCRLPPLTFDMCLNDDSYHWWNTVGEPISFSGQHVVGREDSA